MLHRRRGLEGVERHKARRAREDGATRLRDRVPALASLRLEFEEYRADGGIAEPGHVRKVVVERAPALFVVPCHEPACGGEGHDVTADVMRALESRAGRFEGEDRCDGECGGAVCGRLLRYVGLATYDEAAGAGPRPRAD